MSEQINIQVLIDNVQGSKTLGDLKRSLAEVRKAQNEVGIGTKAFDQLNDALDEGSERVRTFRRGFDEIKAFATVGQTLAASFGIATAAISAFGLEGTNAEKALLKVQSALTIVQSFTALKEAIDAAKAANVALNASLLTNPYVLLAAGIAAAIVAFGDFSEKTDEAFQSTKLFNEELEKSLKIYDKLSPALERQQRIELSAAKTSEEKAKIKIKFIQEELKLVEKARSEIVKRFQQENISVEDVNKLREEQNKLIERELDLKADIVVINNELKNEVRDKKEVNQVQQESIDILEEYNVLLENQRFELQILNDLGASNQVQVTRYNEILDERLLKLNALEVKARNEIKDAKNLAAELAKINSERDKLVRTRIEINLPQIPQFDNIFNSQQLTNINKQLNTSFRLLLDPLSLKIANLSREVVELGDSAQGAIKKIELIKVRNEFNKISNELLAFQKRQQEVVIGLEIIPNQINNIFKAIKIGIGDTSYFDLITDSIKLLGETIEQSFFTKELDDLLNKTEIDVESFFNIVKNSFTAFENQQANVKAGYDELLQSNKITFEEYVKGLNDAKEAGNLALDSFTQKIADTIAKVKDPSQKQILESFFAQFVINAGLAIESLDSFDDRLKRFLNDFNKGLAYINTVQSGLFDIFQRQSQNRIDALENERASFEENLDKQLEADLLTQEQYAERRRLLDEEYNAKLREQKAEQFRTQKAADVIQATINTALAVSRALSEGGIIGPVLAGVVGAIGAVQIGLIASQPEPQFAEGGLFTGAGGPKDDSNRIRISNGEYIVNARATDSFLPLLEAINSMGNYQINTLGGSKTNSLVEKPVERYNPQNNNKPQRVFVVQSDISKANRTADNIKTRVTF